MLGVRKRWSGDGLLRYKAGPSHQIKMEKINPDWVTDLINVRYCCEIYCLHRSQIKARCWYQQCLLSTVPELVHILHTSNAYIPQCVPVTILLCQKGVRGGEEPGNSHTQNDATCNCYNCFIIRVFPETLF